MARKGVAFESVDYTRQPLTAALLKSLLRGAGLKPMEAMRTKEEAYKKLVAGKDLDDERLVALMVKHPELIQRPLVARGNKAVLARPVERLADLGV